MSSEPLHQSDDENPTPPPPTHFDRIDDRWSVRSQLRDWGILFVMVAVYLIWAGIIYFFEPGIR